MPTAHRVSARYCHSMLYYVKLFKGDFNFSFSYICLRVSCKSWKTLPHCLQLIGFQQDSATARNITFQGRLFCSQICVHGYYVSHRKSFPMPSAYRVSTRHCYNIYNIFSRATISSGISDKKSFHKKPPSLLFESFQETMPSSRKLHV